MKLYLKLLMFTLMISDARIIVNEIMRESAESPMVHAGERCFCAFHFRFWENRV